jgi:hypothetical protein
MLAIKPQNTSLKGSPSSLQVAMKKMASSPPTWDDSSNPYYGVKVEKEMISGCQPLSSNFYYTSAFRTDGTKGKSYK